MSATKLLNPKAALPAARLAARKTRQRPPYAAPQAPVIQPLQPTRERRMEHPWPFPETAIKGTLVRNRFSPGLCMTMEVLRCLGLARPL